MLEEKEIEFAQRAVHWKCLSSEQINECKTIKAKLLQKDQKMTLWEIALRKKFLTKAQIQDIFSYNTTKETLVNEPENSENSSVARSFSTGNQFLHYQILKKLGEGGMGVVYKALDTRVQRIVALKVITNGGHFLEEASAIAQLQHPNIVRLLELGNAPENYFTMEYIEGKCLDYYIAYKKLSHKEFAKILAVVVEALHEAHKKNVIHCDIKPSNIIVDKNMVPKLMDFGIARLPNTQRDSAVGTPAYMSPEQAENGRIDKRSDIYSLGATMYEALTGRRPFEGDSLQILAQIFHEDPILPQKLNPSIPIELQSICMKCLEKDPKKRYNSAKQLALDLKNHLENRPILARPAGRLKTLGKFLYRNRYYCSIAIFVMLLLIASIAFYLKTIHNYNQRLQQEKQISAEASRQIFTALHDVYFQNPHLQNQPSLQKGLKEVLQQLERLEAVAKTIGPAEKQKILWLSGVVYGRSKNDQEFAKGIEIYDKIIAEDENSVYAYLNRAQMLYEKAKYQEALYDLQKVIQKSPKLAKPYILVGAIYANQERYADAIASYNKALQQEPNSHEAIYNRGKSHLKLGKSTLALQDFTNAIALNPQNAEVYYERGTLYLNHGNLPEAEQDLSVAIRIDNKHAKAYVNRGNCYLHLQQLPKAEKDYQQAIALDPNIPQVYANYAHVLTLQQQFDKAEQAYGKSLQLDPKNSITYNNRGLFYSELGKYLLAEQDFNDALRYNPRNPAIYVCRGTLFRFMGKYPQALADFSQAIQLQNNFLEAYIKRASLYNMLGRNQQADSDMAIAKQLDPQAENIYKQYQDDLRRKNVK